MAAARQQPRSAWITRSAGRALLRRLLELARQPCDLPLLPPAEARSYCSTVRNKALDRLDALPPAAGVRRVRLRSGGRSQEPTRRDHAAGVEHAVRARVPRRGAALPPGRQASRARRCWCPPAVRSWRGRGDRTPSLDNERSAHGVDVPAFRIGRVPVTNGEWRRFIDDGGYTSTAGGPTAAGRTGRGGAAGAEFWNTGVRAPAPDSATSRRFRPTSRCSTSRSSKPRPTPRGPVRGCPPRWSGRRPARGTRGGRAPPISVGRFGTHRRSSPTSAVTRCGPRPWALPGGGVGLRRRADARRRVGVDHVAAAAVAGLHAELYEQYSHRSSTATTRCFAAARGRWPRASCGRASATGTIRSAARSSRVCVWPGTWPDVPPSGLAR